MDIVGAAQAECDAPQLLENGSEQKAGGDTNAVHTHEGEPMKSFEVPIPEQDIIGVRSGAVLDPAKVQAARQTEIDSIARHEVVELVATSECKQGAHVKGGLVEDNKSDIVRSRFVAKQVAYNPRETTSIIRHQRYSSCASCSALRSPSRRSSAAARWCCPFGTSRWRSSML